MLPITLSPETAYVTKPNIAYPGSQAQATAAEGLAESTINDFYDSFLVDGNVAVTVAAGSIVVAS